MYYCAHRMSIIMSFLGADGNVFVNIKDSCAHAKYNYELNNYNNCRQTNNSATLLTVYK